MIYTIIFSDERDKVLNDLRAKLGNKEGEIAELLLKLREQQAGSIVVPDYLY